MTVQISLHLLNHPGFTPAAFPEQNSYICAFYPHLTLLCFISFLHFALWPLLLSTWPIDGAVNAPTGG